MAAKTYTFEDLTEVAVLENEPVAKVKDEEEDEYEEPTPFMNVEEEEPPVEEEEVIEEVEEPTPPRAEVEVPPVEEEVVPETPVEEGIFPKDFQSATKKREQVPLPALPNEPTEADLPSEMPNGLKEVFVEIADAHGTIVTSMERDTISYGAGEASKHALGLAADYRTHHFRTKEQGDALIQDLEDHGFWVNDERYNWMTINPRTGKQRGTGPHIHAEWRGEGPPPVAGMLEPGNISLKDRPVVHNADGTVSTVDSISVNLDGAEVLIPTISRDGTRMSIEESVAEYERTGEHLGKFRTPEEATTYGERLHNQQAVGIELGTAPPAPGPKTYSFEELEDVAVTYNAAAGEPEVIEESGFMDEGVAKLISMYFQTGGILVEKGKDIYDTVKNKFDPEQTKTFTKTPESVERVVQGMSVQDAKRVRDLYAGMTEPETDYAVAKGLTREEQGLPPLPDVVTYRYPSDRQVVNMARRDAINKEKALLIGFWNHLDHPAKLILEDSLPANFVEFLALSPERNYYALLEVNTIIEQNKIVRNPENYTPEEVKDAQEAIASRMDPDKTKLDLLAELIEAGRADPGGMAAQFLNFFTADFWLMVVPQATGMKLGETAAGGTVSTLKWARAVNEARKARQFAEGASATASDVTMEATKIQKALMTAGRVADKAIDPAVAGAIANVTIQEVAARSEGRKLTEAETWFAAISGGVPAGLIGFTGLYKVFKKGKVNRTNAEEAGAADALREKIITQPDWWQRTALTPAARAKIEAILGVTRKGPLQEQTSLHNAQQAETLAAVDTPVYWENYFRTKELVREARKSVEAFQTGLRTAIRAREEGIATGLAEDIKTAEVDKAWRSHRGWETRRRRAGFQQDFERASETLASRKRMEEAIAYRDNLQEIRGRTNKLFDEYKRELIARDRSKFLSKEAQIYQEKELREALGKLDEQDIFEAATSGNVGAVQDAMGRALRRDARLAVPKWKRKQMGFADPKLNAIVATLGIGALFAGTAYLVSPEEEKISNTFLVGLFSLAIPAAMSVTRGSRADAKLAPYRQIGAVNIGEGLQRAGAIDEQGRSFLFSDMVGEGGEHIDMPFEAKVARDRVLAKLAAEGDTEAIGRLIDLSKPVLSRIAARYAKRDNALSADDILQDTYKNIFVQDPNITNTPAIKDFQGVVPFTVWASTLVANKAKNFLKAAGTQKRGKGEVESLHTTNLEGEPVDLTDLGAGSQYVETPEAAAIRDDYRRTVFKVLEDKSPRDKAAFLMRNVEGMTHEEIAGALGITKQHSAVILNRLNKEVVDALTKEYGLTPPKSRRDTRYLNKIKQKQSGKASVKELAVIAGIIGVPAALMAWRASSLNETGKTDKYGIHVEGELGPKDRGYRSPTKAFLGTAAAAMLVLFGGRGRVSKSFRESVAAALVPVSTRVLEISPPVFYVLQKFEMTLKQSTSKHLKSVAPFLKDLAAMPKAGRDPMVRALMSNDKQTIDTMLLSLNNPQMTANYKIARATIDSLNDQLADMSRRIKGVFEYFPRMIEDYDGLYKAIGPARTKDIQNILKMSDADSIRRTGHPLNEIDRSRLVNAALYKTPLTGKNLPPVPADLQMFYFKPEDSLSTFVRYSVQEIEKARLYGRYAKSTKPQPFQYIDNNLSIRKFINKQQKRGKIDAKQAEELIELLQTRFGKGDASEPAWIQQLKNIGNMGMLGNLWSAGAQVADIGVQMLYVQGLRSTIESLARQLTGKKHLDVDDFGIVDHVSEEFSTQLSTSKWVNKWLRLNLFLPMDAVGKNTALNAAFISGVRKAKVPQGAKVGPGYQAMYKKYGEIFGKDFSKLMTDLAAGKRSELTDLYSWMEITRTQPLSKLEMTQAYLNNPGLRSLWWMKSFVVKQLDLIHRDAVWDIKSGEFKRVGRGMKNLFHAGIAMGLSGASVKYVQEWARTGEQPEMGWGDIPLNMFRNLGFSEYNIRQFAGVTQEEAAAARERGEVGAKAQKARPVAAAFSVAAPPYTFMQNLIVGEPEAVKKYIPWISPYVIEQHKQAEIELRKAEAEEKKKYGQ